MASKLFMALALVALVAAPVALARKDLEARSRKMEESQPMVISWNPTADKNETTCWPARNITIHAGVDAVSALVPVMNGTVAFDLWIGSEKLPLAFDASADADDDTLTLHVHAPSGEESCYTDSATNATDCYPARLITVHLASNMNDTETLKVAHMPNATEIEGALELMDTVVTFSLPLAENDTMSDPMHIMMSGPLNETICEEPTESAMCCVVDYSMMVNKRRALQGVESSEALIMEGSQYYEASDFLATCQAECPAGFVGASVDSCIKAGLDMDECPEEDEESSSA